MAKVTKQLKFEVTGFDATIPDYCTVNVKQISGAAVVPADAVYKSSTVTFSAIKNPQKNLVMQATVGANWVINVSIPYDETMRSQTLENWVYAYSDFLMHNIGYSGVNCFCEITYTPYGGAPSIAAGSTVIITVNYETEEEESYDLYWFDGAKWMASNVYVFDGSKWRECEVYDYDGSVWQKCGTT